MKTTYRKLLCLLCFWAGLGAWEAGAATIYVSPSGNDANDGSSWALAKQTIDGAILAVSSGDTILVTNGNYGAVTGTVMEITLRSVNGPEVTIIDAQGTGRCISGINEGSLVGFTLRNGNTVDAGGGTILSRSSISNCIVQSNTAGYGGGLAAHDESRIIGCRIENNTSTNDGGGVFTGWLVVVSNCLIRGNVAATWGGGVNAMDSQIVNSEIDGNRSGEWGGGVLAMDSQIVNCLVRSNSAAERGGGLVLHGATTVRNTLVAGNRAGADGGGIFSDMGVTLESVTVVGNSSGSGRGGGLYSSFLSSGGYNSILYFNEDNDIYSDFEDVTLTHCCYGVSEGTITGSGTITNNPMFMNAGSGYGTNHVAGDYRLQTTSPCVDTGTNQAWMAGALDLAGTNRIVGGTVNMGAYEATGVQKLAQTITFGAIPDQVQTNVLTLSATASSGLPVTFSVVSGPATLASGNRLSFSAPGSVTVRASQAGNTTYDPAEPVDRTFRVLSTTPFRLQSVALTNSVVLRWPNPMDHGEPSPDVAVLVTTNGFEALDLGEIIYFGTNTSFVHTNLTPGQPYYYRIYLDVP
jgi:hypothetical protein